MEKRVESARTVVLALAVPPPGPRRARAVPVERSLLAALNALAPLVLSVLVLWRVILGASFVNLACSCHWKGVHAHVSNARLPPVPKQG